MKRKRRKKLIAFRVNCVCWEVLLAKGCLLQLLISSSFNLNVERMKITRKILPILTSEFNF